MFSLIRETYTKCIASARGVSSLMYRSLRHRGIIRGGMNAEIGLKIKSLRLALNESQAVFGDRFGVEQATVSRWEKGLPVGRPFEDMIAGLAGMSVAEFFHSHA